MSKKAKAVFLDRDGVINKPCNSRPPNHPGELELYPGVPQAIRSLNEGGFLVFVVTNQGGVGLGYLSPEDLGAIHRKMLGEIKKGGGVIEKIKTCPHKPQAGCFCRKPRPGLLLDLADEYNLDFARSFLIGDRESDLKAGRAVGATTILIQKKGPQNPFADQICPDLAAACAWILKGG